MRITNTQLKRIVREELRYVLKRKPELLKQFSLEVGAADDSDQEESCEETEEELAALRSFIAHHAADGIEEGAKKKPWCGPGNPYFDQDGRFTDPSEEPGSSSRHTPGADCKRGQASRKTASRKETFTKVKCGRGAKYRCKDGTAKWGPGAVRKEEAENTPPHIKARKRRAKEREDRRDQRRSSELQSQTLQQLARGLTEKHLEEVEREALAQLSKLGYAVELRR